MSERPLGPIKELPPAQRALVEELRTGRGRMRLSLVELAREVHSSKASISRWLSGSKPPTREQALWWAERCGTDVARMGELWDDAEAERRQQPGETNLENGPGDEPAPASKWKREPKTRWALAAAASIMVAAVLGVVVIRPARIGTPPSLPGPCRPYSARVSAPAAAERTFDIAVDVVCPPPQGRFFWLFIRGDNVGDHGTTNYYPNFRLPVDGDRHVTQNYVKPSDPDGERFYVVVSVEEEISATLTDKREFVNRLPPSGEIVSNSVRTVISHPKQPG